MKWLSVAAFLIFIAILAVAHLSERELVEDRKVASAMGLTHWAFVRSFSFGPRAKRRVAEEVQSSGHKGSGEAGLSSRKRSPEVIKQLWWEAWRILARNGKRLAELKGVGKGEQEQP